MCFPSNDFLVLEDRIIPGSGQDLREGVVFICAIGVHIYDIGAAFKWHYISYEPLSRVLRTCIDIFHVGKVVPHLLYRSASVIDNFIFKFIVVCIQRGAFTLKLPNSANTEHFFGVGVLGSLFLEIRTSCGAIVLIRDLFPDQGHLCESDRAFVQLPQHAELLILQVDILILLPCLVASATVSPAFSRSVGNIVVASVNLADGQEERGKHG